MPSVTLAYGYDAAGRVTEETRTWNSGASTDTLTCGYTNNNQLTSLSHTNSSFANEGFTWDAKGSSWWPHMAPVRRPKWAALWPESSASELVPDEWACSLTTSYLVLRIRRRGTRVELGGQVVLSLPDSHNELPARTQSAVLALPDIDATFQYPRWIRLTKLLWANDKGKFPSLPIPRSELATAPWASRISNGPLGFLSRMHALVVCPDHRITVNNPLNLPLTPW